MFSCVIELLGAFTLERKVLYIYIYIARAIQIWFWTDMIHTNNFRRYT